MNSHELADNKNNQNNNESNGWLDMADSLNNGKKSIDMHEIDRSTNVGWLVGATLDAYDRVATAAANNGLSRPVVLGSGAMYMHAINTGRYSMAELNRSYAERRNFVTTSHGVDIDFGLSSDGEVDQLVKLAGGDSRQIPIKNNEGMISVADLMVREPQPGFEPVAMKAGDKEVMLRNPEAMMFGKINLLNEKPVDQIQQKWGYDVPMLMNIVDSYHGDNGNLDEYLTNRYLEYQRVGIDSRLKRLPAEIRLDDVVAAQDIKKLLPKADDGLIQHLLDSKAGEIDAANLPAECFNDWNESYAEAMDKYKQANILAAQRELDKVVS